MMFLNLLKRFRKWRKSSVYGVYDIVSKVNAESTTALKETVLERIRRVDKVRSTLTMIVMNS